MAAPGSTRVRGIRKDALLDAGKIADTTGHYFRDFALFLEALQFPGSTVESLEFRDFSGLKVVGESALHLAATVAEYRRRSAAHPNVRNRTSHFDTLQQDVKNKLLEFSSDENVQKRGRETGFMSVISYEAWYRSDMKILTLKLRQVFLAVLGAIQMDRGMESVMAVLQVYDNYFAYPVEHGDEAASTQGSVIGDNPFFDCRPF